MLKKLIKYDLKYKFKALVIFYSLSIFFGILTRIFFSIENSVIMNIIAQICSGTTISMIFNILINNIMRSWVRFKQNIYGDESYLTHTLPVDKKTLYTSKILSSIITIFTSFIVVALTLFIAYYSKENMEIVKSILLPVAKIYESSMLMILIAFLLILFLEFINILECGYTGIILGHKMSNGKTGFSVLYGFGVYSVLQVFVLISLFIVALFNKDFMNLFFTNEIINIDTIKLIIYLAMIIYTVTFIIGHIVNIKLFKKGVNVD